MRTRIQTWRHFGSNRVRVRNKNPSGLAPLGNEGRANLASKANSCLGLTCIGLNGQSPVTLRAGMDPPSQFPSKRTIMSLTKPQTIEAIAQRTSTEKKTVE